MPTFGNTNDLLLAHVAETTYGVTPANPAMKRLRINGETLNPRVAYDESAEINPNYSLGDLIPVGQEAGGSIPFDFAKEGSMDEILEAVLRGTWTAGVLKGGKVARSFTIEKMLAGGANNYMKFPGSRYNGFTLEGSIGGKLTGSMEIMASNGLPSTTSVLGTGTMEQPVGNRIMSMVDVTSFTLTGDTTPLVLSSFSLGITNNCRYQQGHGQLAAYGIGYGQREVTFSCEAYFETWEQMNKLVTHANNNLQLTISDGVNSYVIRLPKFRFSAVEASAGANNADLMQSLEGRALYDSTAGILTDIMVTRAPL